MNELRQIRRSVATLEGHYRAQKKRGNNSPSPEPILFQDVLLAAEASGGFHIGPTAASGAVLNHFQVRPTLSVHTIV